MRLAEDNCQLTEMLFSLKVEKLYTITNLQLFISKSNLVEKCWGFGETGLKLMIL